MTMRVGLKSVRSEAFACWKWSGFLQSCGDQDKPLLIINMDETSVKLCPQVRKGWIVAGPEGLKSLRRRGPGLSLAERRSAITLVSFLADKPEYQHLLPHVFLSNMHILSEKEAQDLNETTPENTLFVRQTSGWVNFSILVDILKVLAIYLDGIMDTHRVVLCMDTYKSHLHVDVIRQCTDLGFLLHFIPASLTAWLQPLDVVVFKKYKDWIARETERSRVSSPTGRLSKVEVFRVCAAGVHAVMEGEPWGRAFELAGLRGQVGIAAELSKRLGFDGPVSVPPALPSAADLMAVYPRRLNIPVDDLFELPVRLSRARPQLVLPKRARLTVKTTPPSSLPSGVEP